MSTGPSTATDPADLGVLEAGALLSQGQLSAEELTEGCLEAIERRNGGDPSFDGSPRAINAWARVYSDRARADARAADERRGREGDATPKLCGIPIGLKDLYGVAGLPLTASSAVLEGHTAAHDATVWSRLSGQGMVLLGHTHTHEFAAGGTTDQVGNPWALDRVAGGSSAGSAAALAARMTPAALGSDTCGSLRIPSACCGTSAIKPTHGLLASEGMIPLAPSLDHPGPMARTIADCSALLAGMLQGRPPVDPTAPPPASLGALPERPRPGARPLGGLTIAITDRVDRLPIEPGVAAALDEARVACERLGAQVIGAPAPWAEDDEDLSRILLTEAWPYHRSHAARRAFYRPAIAEFAQAASGFTDAGPYLDAQGRRAAGASAWELWFDHRGVDLVLEPTLSIEPYGRGPGYDSGHAAGPGDPMIALTALWDLTGMPVASLPVTRSAGVSLIARRGDEAELIAAAIDLQEHELGVPEWTP